MIALKLFLVIAVFAGCTVQFRRCAGSLDLRELNIISLTYYMFIIQVFFGSSLIYLGAVDAHYLAAKVAGEIRDIVYAFVCVIALGLPSVIRLIQLVFSDRTPREKYSSFRLAKCTNDFDEPRLLFCFLTLFFICLVCTVYSFVMMGGFPLLDAITGADSAAALRAEAKFGFEGNEYVRSIGMLTLAPLLCFLSFVAFRVFKSQIWGGCFVASLILALVAMTYDLEKAPAIYLLFELAFLELVLGRTFSRRALIAFGLGFLVLILVSYFVTSGTGSLVFSFVNGPLSRVVTTSASVFMLHFQTFPDSAPFLDGTSLPFFLSNLLGNEEGWVRAGRVVMEVYNPSGIAAGTAGVMSAFFPAEAYANWGFPGALLAVLFVGALLGASHEFIVGREKTIFSVMAYLIIVRAHLNFFNSGFVDYLYNVPLLFSLGLLGLLYLCTKKEYGKRESTTTNRSASGLQSGEI